MSHFKRRRLLQTGSWMLTSWSIAIAAKPLLVHASPANSPRAEPTPACGQDQPLTPASIEGPYFTPASPQRNSLIEPDIVGTRLLLSGVVLSPTCQPIAAALLDFWQANHKGEYDNVGFKLRGHQFTDSQGRYYLETIVPGLYPGRVRHLHVKVQAANQPILTTQLYFPNEPGNGNDAFFRSALLMQMKNAQEIQRATFNFVVSAG